MVSVKLALRASVQEALKQFERDTVKLIDSRTGMKADAECSACKTNRRYRRG
jgi:hypothetical protein